jgi:hypothetical protein
MNIQMPVVYDISATKQFPLILIGGNCIRPEPDK